jgi:peptide/nickel transport system substrate-binding protein
MTLTRKRLLAGVALVATLAVLGAACSGGDEPTTPAGTSGGTGGGTTTPPGGVQTGGTYRVETDGIAWTSGGDPTGEYLGIAFGIFSNLLGRTLLTYPHTTGDTGNSVVPDLAADLPEVSSDGMTYTYTLKDGIMFGDPLNRPITSADISYAFRRMMLDSVVAQYEFYYDGLVDGLTVQTSVPDSIPGIETPDDQTIIFHLTRVSPDFTFLSAMPATMAIPEEVAGCFAEVGEYGRYVVSSGPYQYEGADQVDATSCDTIKASAPMSGFDPEDHSYFVRNPSYQASTDSPDVRGNYVDEIRMDLNTNAQDIYAKIKAGTIDGAVSSGNPPADVLQDYATDPDLQPLLKQGGDDRTWYITMNLTTPPFDDIHVRKAVNLIMDKAGILQAWGGEISGVIATHIQPPALSGLGADYDPYATPNFAGDETAAKAEMALSKYDTDGDGMCDAPECSGLKMINRATSPWTESEPVVVASLQKIGIGVDVTEAEDHYTIIQTVSNNIPIAMDPGWGKDYPDSSSFVGFLFDGRGIKAEGNYNYSLTGITQAQAGELGVTLPSEAIGSVDADIDNCKQIALTDEQGGLDCWNNVDKKLMEDIVPWVPYLWPNIITTISSAVTNWDFDQFSGSTAWSKVAVDASLQG